MRRAPWLGYAVAVAAWVAAFAITHATEPYLQESHYLFFYAAVAVTAWLGGLGPSLLLAVITVPTVGYWFFQPREAFEPGVTDVTAGAVLVLVAMAVSSMHAAVREERRRAELSARTALREAEQVTSQSQELESARKEVERIKKELDAILQTTVDGITAHDTKGRLLYVNWAAARMLGYASSTEMIASPSDHLKKFDLLDENGFPMPADKLPGRLCASGEGSPEAIVCHRDRASGAERWSHIKARAVLDSEGKPALIVNVCRDITEQVQQRRKLEEQNAVLERSAAESRALTEKVREGEERFRTLADSAPVMIRFSDAGGRDEFCNAEWVAFTGQGGGDRPGSGWPDVIHAEDRERCVDVIGSALQQRRDYELEYRLRRADGEYRWVLERGVPRDAADEKKGGFIHAGVDVTERRRALERAQRLQGATVRLGTAGSAAEVMDVMLEEGGPALEATGACLALPEPGPELEVVARAGKLGAWADASHLAAAPESGEREYIALPVRISGSTEGVLAFGFGDPRAVDENDRGFALALARLAGQALERVSLQENERRLRDVVEAASRGKADFLAAVSHELRTPLNAILGYSSLLAEEVVGSVSETQRLQLGRIRSSAEDLLSLIEQILSLSRIEAGREQLHLERVDVCGILRDTAALVRPVLHGKDLEFALELPDEQLCVEVDATKLRQIMLNLLSNAAKFTDAGGVHLGLQRAPGSLRITVRDTGAGIAEEHLERIFEPFWQVEQSMSRRPRGAGLGLTVARHLARLLGGDLRASSEPGIGSTFTVSLPGEVQSASPRSVETPLDLRERRQTA